MGGTLAYDRLRLALLADQMLRERHASLSEIADAVNVHRHTINSSLRSVFGCGYSALRRQRQQEHIQELAGRSMSILTKKELAVALGYSDSRSAARRIRRLLVDP
jgi:AraC-like DNA-binding protein